VTGMAAFNAELAAKRLQPMKELMPNLDRVAVLRNPLTKENIPGWHSVTAAAKALGLALQPLDVRTPTEFEGVFKAARDGRAQALLILDDAFLSSQLSRIAPLATEARLPSNPSWREGTEAGILFSYGPNLVASYRRAAGYVATILKGAKPADLPVEQPTLFELVINLKTAKAIGITIPQSLLLRADQVIE
jgi:putative ABC transport system substrate-binding protein